MRLRPPFSKAVSFGLYEGVLASVLHHYKFGGIRRLHRPLSRLLPDIGLCADFLVPVPLSSAALRRRGFNQSLLITRRLSMEKGIPLVADGLVKNRDTRPQVGLNMRERASNLKGAFTATRSFSGKKVVLVDDVMTTGATVSECTAELLKAGADEVSVLTLARACVL
jgi:ComF family protein